MDTSITATDGVMAPEPVYARFLPRLRALIIDSMILLLIMFAAVMIATAVRSDNLARPLGFAVAAFWLLYEPLFVSLAGGTLGHIISNLRVVDDRTQDNVSVLKAVTRSIIKGVLGWVSFVTMLTTRRSQAVHDLLTRSTVQIRDISRAGPKLYIRERIELASPALPARRQRALVILAYVVLVSALCFGVGGILAAVGVVSDGCVETDRCSRTEDFIFTAIAVVWVAGCIAAIALGWRGRLYGARRQA